MTSVTPTPCPPQDSGVPQFLQHIFHTHVSDHTCRTTRVAVATRDAFLSPESRVPQYTPPQFHFSYRLHRVECQRTPSGATSPSNCAVQHVAKENELEEPPEPNKIFGLCVLSAALATLQSSQIVSTCAHSPSADAHDARPITLRAATPGIVELTNKGYILWSRSKECRSVELC